MLKNVTGQKIRLFAFDTTTGAPKTGDAANLTAYVSKDRGTLTALGDTTATEVSSTNAAGMYEFDLTQAETNADVLDFTGKSSTANIAIVPILNLFTRPQYSTIQAIDSSGRVTVGSAAADSINASALATDAVTEITNAILAMVIEGSTTFQQSMRLHNAALGGKASGLATTTAVYRDLADTKARITATVDADGNRTAVTTDLT